MSDNNHNQPAEELREHAIEEAKRIKENVQGDTETLRIRRAILDRERELSGFEVEYKQAQRQITDAEQEAERIRETMRRLGESPDTDVMEQLPDGTLMAVPADGRDAFVSRLGESPDTDVMEQLPDGTLMAVPADGRDAFVSRLNTDLSEAQSRAEQQRDRAESIQRGLVTNKLAIEWLEDELAQTTDNDDGGGE